ncbi:phosphopantetheine-binding protein [Streptomyces olivaceoviridis]
MDVKTSVREFLLSTSAASTVPAEEITDDYPLLSSGLLDSLAVYTLVVHLEKAFGITVRDQELHPGNFGTIELITEFTEAKIHTLAESRESA